MTNIADKRQCPRVTTSLPVNILPDTLGKAIDISESGSGLILDKPLLLSKVTAKIAVSPKESIEAELDLIWRRHLAEKDQFKCGVCFVGLKEQDMAILRKAISDTQAVDEKFVQLTEDFREYSEDLKKRFDAFDKDNPGDLKQIAFVGKEKAEIYRKFYSHFTKVWEIVSGFDQEKHNLYKRYYISRLYSLYGNPIELNRHVYTKPLGYAGDYLAMIYTYDYHGQAYLGDSSFQKLVNMYTSITPIWNSNVIRKDFLKDKILETIASKDNPKIASIGSGPLREFLELLSGNEIKKGMNFLCLDFDQRALDYVKNEFSKISKRSKEGISMTFLQKNIIELIKDRGIVNRFDLIYVSGVFDYLSDRLCARILKKLFELLAGGGRLIVCNASSEKASYRGYYEFLGDWVMIYRTREEMLAWTKNLVNAGDVQFERPGTSGSYWFLSINKLRQQNL